MLLGNNKKMLDDIKIAKHFFPLVIFPKHLPLLLQQ